MPDGGLSHGLRLRGNLSNMTTAPKETLAQALARHGHIIACPGCGTYMAMADVDPAAIAAAYNTLELAKLIKSYATDPQPRALAITCVTCRG